MVTTVLEKDKEITVVGAATSTEDAAIILSKRGADVVPLDIEVPGTSGLDYLVAPNRLGIPVVMLSGQTAEGSEA
jgi:chemotaxis response regulator CheB